MALCGGDQNFVYGVNGNFVYGVSGNFVYGVNGNMGTNFVIGDKQAHCHQLQNSIATASRERRNATASFNEIAPREYARVLKHEFLGSAKRCAFGSGKIGKPMEEIKCNVCRICTSFGDNAFKIR